MTARVSREQVARTFSARDQQARRDILTNARPKLYVDTATIPPGSRYKWVRIAVAGQPDPDNVSENMEMGWRPVPPERHPELVPPVFGDFKRPEGYIQRRDMVLMERQEEVCQEDEDILKQYNLQILEDVDRGREKKQDPTMPATRRVRTKRIVGAEPGETSPPDLAPGSFDR